MSESHSPSEAPSLLAFRDSLTHRAELPKDNKLGVAALSFGSVGLALVWLLFAGPALGLVGGCLGVMAMVGSKRKNKPKRAAVWGVVVSILALTAGSIYTVAEVQAWHRLRSCNHRFDPVADDADNYICVYGHPMPNSGS